MMKTLICIDRDGTLIHDEKYHLGRTNDWKSKIKFLPKAIAGIKQMNKIPESAIYMITNQPGVAVKQFKLLTLDRARQVCQEVIERIRKRGAKIDGYFLCPHASPKYTRKRSNYKFHKKLVCKCSCIKPDLGMVFDALKAENITTDKVHIHVIGDRESDVQTALNIGGTAIFIPFRNEPEHEPLIRKKYGKNKDVYFAKDLLEASIIISRISRKENRSKNRSKEDTLTQQRRRRK